MSRCCRDYPVLVSTVPPLPISPILLYSSTLIALRNEAVSFSPYISAGYRTGLHWPDPVIDEIEDLVFEPASILAFGVASCEKKPFPSSPSSGRTNAQEWVRTAYHDMATADVQAGTGGIDASIAFEASLNRPENVGSGRPAAGRGGRGGRTPR